MNATTISSFDSIRLKIENINKSGGELHIDGFTSIANLKLNHKRIASKDVLIKTHASIIDFLLGPILFQSIVVRLYD
jgi:hypothetical protein